MIRHCLHAVVALLVSGFAAAEEVRLAVTTSFDNSGLADVLVPAIARDTGLDVQLLVVGTGQALRLGRAGDVDAILVHARAAEEAFVANGFGTHRREIMYNDFVLIGPVGDPAAVTEAGSVREALLRIGSATPAFVSRGDDSGTHKKELALWADAGLEPDTFGAWYRQVGAGMGASLNTAAGLDAYILADRASWLNFGNKADLALLFSGDPVLFNQYSFLPVDPEMHPHVHSERVVRLEAWLTSSAAEQLIDAYTIGDQTLFTFNAKPRDSQ
ncbi:MAG: substrate-binding domain-containing protein [Pseudomonadota bacterium]